MNREDLLLTDQEITETMARLAEDANYHNGVKAIAEAQLDKALRELALVLGPRAKRTFALNWILKAGKVPEK